MSGGALAGLRVLDAATLYAAPLISSLLADHGADVVRLEPPGGDPYRASPAGLFGLTGRNKRSLVLDLEQEADRARLHSVIPAVDVVVVNEPTHRLRGRGLDHDTLAGLNPALVLVHVSGYGLDGPNANRPGNGTLGEAFAGLTHMTGHPDQAPMLPSVPLGDAVTAFAGAFGVLAACYQRMANGGPGQVVDVNPVDAMLHVTAPVFTAYDGGEPPHRLAGGLAGALLRNVFGTRDGHWVAVSVSTARQFGSLCALIGHPAPAGAEDALRAWVAARPRGEVMDCMVSAGVPTAPVNDAQDLIDDPHLRYRQALRTMRSEGTELIRVPAPAPRLSDGPRPTADRLPRAGEHTSEVLREWGP